MSTAVKEPLQYEGDAYYLSKSLTNEITNLVMMATVSRAKEEKKSVISKEDVSKAFEMVMEDVVKHLREAQSGHSKETILMVIKDLTAKYGSTAR